MIYFDKHSPMMDRYLRERRKARIRAWGSVAFCLALASALIVVLVLQ